MSPLDIRRAILRILAEVKPYELPFAQLLAMVNAQVRPELSTEGLTGHLRWLLDEGMVDFIADDLDPRNEAARSWLIKKLGEAALRR